MPKAENLTFQCILRAMGQRYNTYAEVKEELFPQAGIQSLYIASTDTSKISTGAVFVELNQVDRLLLRGKHLHRIRAVNIETEESSDSLFRIVIEKSAVASGREKAAELAGRAEFHASLRGDTLLIDPWVGFPANEPYHFEHVTITVYYPKGGRVITSGVLKQQLDLHCSAGRNGFYIESHENEDEVPADEVSGEPLPDSVLRVEDVPAYADEQRKEIREARERLDEARRAEADLLKEKERELEQMQRDLERDRREAEREREEAERELERALQKDRTR